MPQGCFQPQVLAPTDLPKVVSDSWVSPCHEDTLSCSGRCGPAAFPAAQSCWEVLCHQGWDVPCRSSETLPGSQLLPTWRMAPSTAGPCGQPPLCPSWLIPHHKGQHSKKNPAPPLGHWPLSRGHMGQVGAEGVSQVEPEGPKVAGCCIVGVDGQGGDGDKELITGLELEESPLVERVEPVVGLGCPALGAHALEQQHGWAVGRLPLDALHQLRARVTAGAAVAEIDLGVHVVLARLLHAQPPSPVRHVLHVGLEAAVPPVGDGVAARLGEIPEALGASCGKGVSLWGAA